MRRAFVLSSVLWVVACGDDGTDSEASDTGAATDPGTSTTATDGSSTTGDVETSGDASTSTTTSSSSTGDQTSTTSESGTGESTGEVRGDQWADAEITYSGPGVMESVTLGGCYFCDATLSAGVALLRFQQADGWTVWSVYLQDSQGVGTHTLTPEATGAYVIISESNPDLPIAVHGFYPFASNVGTVTLTEADITPGGTVSGTIDAELSLNGITATFTAEFSAVLTAL